MSQAVFHRIATSSNVQAFVRGSINGNITMPMNAANLATALADYGIERVLIGRARQNTAKKGQAKSVSPIWNNTYVWVGRVNPAALTPQSGGAGFIFYWNLEGGLYVSETYRDESRRSNIVRVRQNTTEKLSDTSCGTLITTQYS
jgi:hypothetical protein